MDAEPRLAVCRSPVRACTHQGKEIEILACYEPCFRFMAEWWKQLYGESEGKEGKGLFPASVEYHRRPALHGAVYPGGRPAPV